VIEEDKYGLEYNQTGGYSWNVRHKSEARIDGNTY
jgi:hypothetical protein